MVRSHRNGSAAANPPIRVGDVVPDVPLLDHTGAAWRFSDHRDTPILAILHRHLA